MTNSQHKLPLALDWTIVVAMDLQGLIGRKAELPWRLSTDLKRFKRLTMGNCLVMGRRTYESIGRPLPGRQTIVLSGSGFVTPDASVTVVRDLEHIPAAVESGRRVMIVGGAMLYASAIAYCQTMWLTRVLTTLEGDVYFPKMDWREWHMLSTEAVPAGPQDEWPSEFQVWRRNLVA